MDFFLGLNVDGSLDVTSGVLVSESTVDDVELGDLGGVLSVDEIVELKKERERGKEEKSGRVDDELDETTRNETKRNRNSPSST